MDSEAPDSKKYFFRFVRSVDIFYELFSSKSCAFLSRHSSPALFDMCIYMTLFVGSYCLFLVVGLETDCFDIFFSNYPFRKTSSNSFCTFSLAATRVLGQILLF